MIDWNLSIYAITDEGINSVAREERYQRRYKGYPRESIKRINEQRELDFIG